ncbi:MAG: hypothetical protein PHE83_13940 [Opitutaceae bacterium]|nr:hypothetical protein [Opitutaceae bacterium]
MKPLVKLIHWHTVEAKAHARRLRAAGHAVDASLPPGPALFRELRRHPPAVIVVSLDRLPSQGRDVALGLLGQKATRTVPIVFAGGAPDKVAGVRSKLPGAAYASWEKLGSVLTHTLGDSRRASPVAPDTSVGVMAGYAGTPLPKKLGIKPGLRVALLGAPKDFARKLGPLPAGAHLTDRVDTGTGLALWFVRTHREFDRGFARTVRLGARMPVWVVSPKRSGPLASDLSQNYIRAECLAAGLVDYKVCALDSAWSGLLFRHRQLG